jgi:hypothetical protein
MGEDNIITILIVSLRKSQLKIHINYLYDFSYIYIIVYSKFKSYYLCF